MNETPVPATLDQATFQQVWRRVMPEDRPDCPFTLNAPAVPAMAPVPPQPIPRPPVIPSSPPVCLGQTTAGEAPILEELLLLTAEGFRSYRMLLRRWGRGGNRTLLSELTAAKGQQLRRLSAAYFLIFGKEHLAPPTPAPTEKTLPLALRERFQAEHRAAAQFRRAAQSTGDPCLAELCQNLAVECRRHADRLRQWFETGR